MSSRSFSIFQSLLKFVSIELVIPSNHLILCRPLSPPTLSLPQHQSLFQELTLRISGQSIGASASVLPMSIQDRNMPC